MPTQCVISDCKSGKKKSKEGSEPESVQTFPFPTETTAKNRWLRHCDLGENIGFYSRLCAKHFQKGCFLSPSENVDDKGRPRTKLRLREGAVPTIFNFEPNPSISFKRKIISSETAVDANLEIRPNVLKKVKVMKVTKQSNGQLLCEICSGIFEDVNGAVKHMPYCEQESVT